MKTYIAIDRRVLIIFLFFIPTTKAKTNLEGHFYLDECLFLSNVTPTLDLQRLDSKVDYALQLETNRASSVRLQADRICTIPSGILYSFTFSIKNQDAFLKFQFIESMVNETSDGKEIDKRPQSCQFSVQKPVEVFNGYGFISCRGTEDIVNVTRAVRKWKEAIELEEAEAKYHKNVLLGSVIGCVILIISVCAICIIMRLKATERPPPSRPRRRPSTPAPSVQTRITNDQNSSSHPPLLSSGSK
ncbi:uncharacterized protein [Palaemon carinicauda]|uniref:uncharacterized protein n=1 Tax=Palaemon carinicauda TaxID=392227 RepID=UPI0035B6038A